MSSIPPPEGEPPGQDEFFHEKLKLEDETPVETPLEKPDQDDLRPRRRRGPVVQTPRGTDPRDISPDASDVDRKLQVDRHIGRVLPLCQKGDWPALDHALKVLEKEKSYQHDSFSPLKNVADEGSGYTPLMYAARDNKVQFIERLVDLGCDPNAKNKEGYAAVHLGTLYGREEVIRTLVQKNADINAPGGPKDQTPAHMVSGRSTGAAVALMKVVLMCGKSDLRLMKDSRGDIPLYIAIEAGNHLLCKELLFHYGKEQIREARAHTRDTALHVACRMRDTDLVRMLVDAGANVNERNAAGQTALHIVAEENDEVTAKYFFNIHVNPNITDKQDRTPIHVAAEKGNTLMVDMLADKFKASVMERTKEGSTLAHIASLYGHPDTVMSFIRKGVPLHMPNKQGERCLHTAAQRGHVGVVNAIIQKGEHVDAATNDGLTALHIAVKYGKPAVVEALLGHGANLTVQGGPAQESALHLAARVKDGDKGAEMLLKSGADPNLPKDDGQTPLHIACEHGNVKALKLLLESGANPIVKSKNGETPLHLACSKCQVEVAKVLIDFVSRKNGKDAVVKLINAKNNIGETSLHYTARLQKKPKSTQDRELARLLLANGGDLSITTTKIQQMANAPSSKGWSPLISAADHGHVAVVKMLLEKQARVDAFDSEGKSSLHIAAEKGYENVCEELLSHKAFINARTVSGLTPLHLAAMRGHKQLAQSLINQYGAMKEGLTLAKQTSLHMAAENGQLEVCDSLLKLGADTNAKTDDGQKAVHLAAMRNHSDVVKLFLKNSPELVTSADKDGNTCAHIAALQGSVDVAKELMRHNKAVVINGRNKTKNATPLHLAAKGGHAELAQFLVVSGASAKVEDTDGFTAVHLAARYGHLEVLETLRKSQQNIRIMSKKLGLSSLHIAAHYGQTETVRDLLTHIPATIKSEVPVLGGGRPFLPDLGAESELTPLHLAASQGNESVVRILLNIPGVVPEVKSKLNNYIPLHLACIGGHISVLGLLLSKSAKQIHITDKRGRTGLHLAATYGHTQMVALLMAQGADYSAMDRDGFTALHLAAREGHIDVVKRLVQSGASSEDQTVDSKTPICFAVSNDHPDVYFYLIQKRHDSYQLLEDKKFVHDLTVMSRKYDHKPLEEFILLSPAPVDLATKLAYTLRHLSDKEKESSKELAEASICCENLATNLVAIASSVSSPGLLLRSVDNRNIEILDSLIEHEQKQVIAHPSVQRYLNDVWMGSLNWPSWKMAVIFLAYLLIPPVWLFFSLPLGHKYNEVPFMKFIGYLVSHIYMLILMIFTVVIPLRPIWENVNLIPNWYEWLLLAWLSGNLVAELTNPGDRAGLGWIKVFVLVFSGIGIFAHLVGIFFLGNDYVIQEILYVRNIFIAVGLLLASVQLLDFLSFHHLFGPWAVIIGKLMVDLGRFLVILSIFMFGFSMYISAIYNPVRPIYNTTQIGTGYPPTEAPIQTPLQTAEMLFFSLFGLVEPDYMPPFYSHPSWAQTLMKIVFGIYQMVTVVVLINLLIAMMSDTYQRIQAKSDTEWKFGLTKLIRNMSRTSGTPSPLNLLLKLFVYSVACFKFKERAMEFMRTDGHLEDKHLTDIKTEYGGGWIKKLKSKSKISAMPQSTENLVPVAGIADGLSQGPRRVEKVINWSRVVARYRAMNRKEGDQGEPLRREDDPVGADEENEVSGGYRTSNGDVEDNITSNAT